MQIIRDHKFITVCVILAVIIIGLVCHAAFAVSPEDIKDREDAMVFQNPDNQIVHSVRKHWRRRRR